MLNSHTISVAPARNLEVGDLVAKEFLGAVVSGKITGIAYASYQLNNKQRLYMADHGLIIPDNEYEGLGGSTSLLIFGEFKGYDFLHGRSRQNHMYVDFNQLFAVFTSTC